MPLVHVSMRTGKSDAYRQAIFDSIYQALRETFDVPDEDQFMAITEHDAANFRFSDSYLGITRSSDVLFIQITVSNTRPVEKKKALYSRIVERLGEQPGIRTEDVFINLVEVLKENWSFGHGQAQYT